LLEEEDFSIVCLNLSVVGPPRYRTRLGALKYRFLKNTVMYISRFQLLNYKSFRDSGALEFQLGINIIVGANNSGKTALLEALTLSFKTSPHRSIETLPQRNSTPIRKSVANVTLIFTKAEIHSLFDNLSPNWYSKSKSFVQKHHIFSS
jgi:hypothetical protein